MQIPTYRPPGSPLAAAYGASAGDPARPYETVDDNRVRALERLRVGLATRSGPGPLSKQAAAAVGDTAVLSVVKATPERRYVLAVAYAANKPDRGRALDGFRDAASAEAVEQAAHSWFAKGRRVGMFHGDLLGLDAGADEGHAEIVESYIYRGPTWHIGGQVVKAGDWLIGAILDPKAWAMAKSGRINGVSLQGQARRTELSAALRAAIQARRA